MEPLVIALILLSALLHSGWNALVKLKGDPLVMLASVAGSDDVHRLSCQAILWVSESRWSWSANNVNTMLDTLAIARTLTDTGLTPEQAAAITDAVRTAAGHDTGDLATLRADIGRDLAALELRLVKWVVGTGIAVAAAVIAALRLIA